MMWLPTSFLMVSFYAELGEQNGINEGSNDPKVLRLYIQVRSS